MQGLRVRVSSLGSGDLELRCSPELFRAFGLRV